MPIEHFGRARRAVSHRVAPHRHTGLLVAIVTVFVLRPLMGDAAAGSAVFSIGLVILLLAALYNINVDELVGERGRLLKQGRRRLQIGWLLAATAVTERLLVFFVHSSRLTLVGSICWLAFFLFVTLSELRSVLKQRDVTGETIAMAVSTYLLLGLTWMCMYSILFQLNPGSFGGPGLPKLGEAIEVEHLFPVLGYFSLTTLSTIGFGDITPLSLQARYAAVAEGITGQFYLAILVARLVALQMTQPAARNVENQAGAVAD